MTRVASLAPPSPTGLQLALRRTVEPAVALTRYRPQPELGPPTPEQQAHLALARRLDVGPLPAVRKTGSSLGGLIDALGFRVMRRFFSGTHRAELEACDYYEMEGGWLERSESAHLDPERYFPRPSPPDVEVSTRGRLDGGVVEDLSFSSADYADRPTARQTLRRYPSNGTAHLRCYRHDDHGRPAVLWLHGWGMGFFGVEALVCRARWLYSLGLDVYLYMQPYHAWRRPAGVTFAGEVFPTTHMTRTNEGLLQAVWEIRAAMAWHRARGGGPCGVVGLSLGGYLAAVLASVAPELAFAVPLLPVADIPTLMWSNGEGTAERRWAEESGVTFEMFCRSMAVHAPLAHKLLIPTENVMLIGAMGDRVIPPLHTEALWEHWDQPQIHWMPGSHLVHFGRRGYLEHLAVFLSRRFPGLSEGKGWTKG